MVNGTQFSLFTRAVSAFVVLFVTASVTAQSDNEQALREQMKEAQQQLDEAAQRVAKLSRQMSGGEVARVVKRMRVGERRAMLGVQIQQAEEGEGVRIGTVTTNGPAAVAGLEANDLVTRFNDVDLRGKDGSDAIHNLLQALKQMEPGDVANLKIIRDGRPLTVAITTGSVEEVMPTFGDFAVAAGKWEGMDEMMAKLADKLSGFEANIDFDGDVMHFEFDDSQIEELKLLPKRLEEAMGGWANGGPVIAMMGGPGGLGHGFRFAPVTPSLGSYFGVDRGVLLTAVPDDEALGFQEGDVLLSVNGEAVNSRGDVHALFASADEGDRLAVEIVRQRESITLDVAVPENAWGRGWRCLSEEGDDSQGKRCVSRDGDAFSFKFDSDN
ncbi:MAG: PDZ domain-containing protein [Pseudomonadota bacterium]